MLSRDARLHWAPSTIRIFVNGHVGHALMRGIFSSCCKNAKIR